MRIAQFMPGIAAVMGGAGLLLGGAALIAGPLTPPAGPAGPTFKTLAEVQPATPVQSLSGNAQALYVIDRPGSYYLTGSITGVSAKDGIAVTADDVTIDLCGFTLDGAAAGNTAVTAQSVHGLAVLNGVIANWSLLGIDALWASGCLFDNLRIHSTTYATGIQTGPGVVRGCAFTGGQDGIYAQYGVQMTDCSVSGVAGESFLLNDACSATRCASYNPGGDSFYTMGNSCSIVDCTIRGGFEGIRLASSGNLVERCKIGQVGLGITANDGNTIVDNTLNAAAAGQGSGITLFNVANRVEGNHLYAYAQGILVYGFNTSNVILGNTLHACTTPISSTGSNPGPLVAPVVYTAAALATDPVANIAQ